MTKHGSMRKDSSAMVGNSERLTVGRFATIQGAEANHEMVGEVIQCRFLV